MGRITALLAHESCLAPARFLTPSSSSYRISARASPLSISRAFSNASIASIKPAPANPEARASAWPSPNTSFLPTAAPSAPKANWPTAPRSYSPSRLPKPRLLLTDRTPKNSLPEGTFRQGEDGTVTSLQIDLGNRSSSCFLLVVRCIAVQSTGCRQLRTPHRCRLALRWERTPR